MHRISYFGQQFVVYNVNVNRYRNTPLSWLISVYDDADSLPVQQLVYQYNRRHCVPCSESRRARVGLQS